MKQSKIRIKLLSIQISSLCNLGAFKWDIIKKFIMIAIDNEGFKLALEADIHLLGDNKITDECIEEWCYANLQNNAN